MAAFLRSIFTALLGLTLGGLPLMAVTITDTGSSYYQIVSQLGSLYNGVGILQNSGGGSVCSAFAISPFLVLTAAHCVQSTGVNTTQVFFAMENLTVVPNAVFVHPDFQGSSQLGSGYDIAVLRFDSNLPVNYYPLYQSNAFPLDIEVVGWGDCGSGALGYGSAGCGPGVFGALRRATNTYETTLADSAFSQNGPHIGLYDFSGPATDDETIVSTSGGPKPCRNNRPLCFATEAGLLTGPSNAGPNEGMHIFGDSGGPSFVNVSGQLQAVGIHSFVTCIGTNSTCSVPPFSAAVGAQLGAFGTIGGDTLILPYAGFIDAAAVPEPGSLLLSAAGLLLLVQGARRCKGARR
jgi:hypothetical protein